VRSLYPVVPAWFFGADAAGCTQIRFPARVGLAPAGVTFGRERAEIRRCRHAFGICLIAWRRPSAPRKLVLKGRLMIRNSCRPLGAVAQSVSA